jgi:hypothetical protein
VAVRLHEGTLDVEKIEAWIKFWQFFLERVKVAKKPLRPYACEDTLFTGIRIDPAMKAKLKAAAANYGTTSRIPDYS